MARVPDSGFSSPEVSSQIEVKEIHNVFISMTHEQAKALNFFLERQKWHATGNEHTVVTMLVDKLTNL